MREINETIRYSMWSVFASASPLGEDRDKALSELEAFLAETAEQGVVVRGLYDVAGLRGDADVMVWWHAATIEQLQAAYHGFLRTEVGQHLEPRRAAGRLPPLPSHRVRRPPRAGVVADGAAPSR